MIAPSATGNQMRLKRGNWQAYMSLNQFNLLTNTSNMRAKLIALAVALGAISSPVIASPEIEFWKWFQRNENALYDFESDQERVFDSLAAQMHKVDPNLTFEFGPKENHKREFVISADGIKAAFPKVESLYAAAPNLNKWTFIKFRPRRAPYSIKIGSVEVKPGDVSIRIEHDGRKAGLSVFISGLTPSLQKDFTSVAYLMLDQALGEFDVETKVGFIEVRERTTVPDGAVSIDDLPKVFDHFLPR